jgi:O-antigen ligase
MNMHFRPAFLRNDPEDRTVSLSFVLMAVALAAAVLLGGASRNNTWQVVAIQLLALPALMHAAWTMATTPGAWRQHRLALIVLALIAATPLLQLIPLPGELWARIPGRQAPAEALRAAGVPIGWRAISLTPVATLGYALALIPPAAVFLSAMLASSRERLWLTIVVIAAALVSVCLGALQVASGGSGPLYFYDPTNWGSAVGLFSNRNHQATLLVVTLPLAALWIRRGRDSERYRIPLLLGFMAVYLIAIIGLFIVKSRAGVFLLPPALLASFLIVWKSARQGERHLPVLLGGATALVLFLAAAFAMGPLMDRFSDGLVDGRGATSATVLDAAGRYLPLGSGVGSFMPVYKSVEPVGTMTERSWNHAHNDAVELWLEAGVLAAVAGLAFVLWWGSAAIAVGRRFLDGRDALGAAGLSCTALVLVHSTVDYPLRTLSMACIFALACAMMERSRSEAAG